jgi:hypothetical protein
VHALSRDVISGDGKLLKELPRSAVGSCCYGKLLGDASGTAIR